MLDSLPTGSVFKGEVEKGWVRCDKGYVLIDATTLGLGILLQPCATNISPGVKPSNPQLNRHLPAKPLQPAAPAPLVPVSDAQMQDDDLYAVLGVSPDASASTITTAYRSLARTHHSDRSGGGGVGGGSGSERWQAIQEAYETLSNPQ